MQERNSNGDASKDPRCRRQQGEAQCNEGGREEDAADDERKAEECGRGPFHRGEEGTGEEVEGDRRTQSSTQVEGSGKEARRRREGGAEDGEEGPQDGEEVGEEVAGEACGGEECAQDREEGCAEVDGEARREEEHTEGCKEGCAQGHGEACDEEEGTQGGPEDRDEDHRSPRREEGGKEDDGEEGDGEEGGEAAGGGRAQEGTGQASEEGRRVEARGAAGRGRPAGWAVGRGPDRVARRCRVGRTITSSTTRAGPGRAEPDDQRDVAARSISVTAEARRRSTAWCRVPDEKGVTGAGSRGALLVITARRRTIDVGAS